MINNGGVAKILIGFFLGFVYSGIYVLVISFLPTWVWIVYGILFFVVPIFAFTFILGGMIVIIKDWIEWDVNYKTKKLIKELNQELKERENDNSY